MCNDKIEHTFCQCKANTTYCLRSLECRPSSSRTANNRDDHSSETWFIHLGRPTKKGFHLYNTVLLATTHVPLGGSTMTLLLAPLLLAWLGTLLLFTQVCNAKLAVNGMSRPCAPGSFSATGRTPCQPVSASTEMYTNVNSLYLILFTVSRG